MHISFSELKDWNFCPFYHKLTRVDKIEGFTGNEFTAFGSAVHSVCEKKLLNESVDDEYFVQELRNNIADLDEELDIDKKLVLDMVSQGKELIPEIETAVKDYFGDYSVEAVEISLMEPIEGEDNYKFKGFIDAVVKTTDGKIHIFDWKTCSWGWNAKKRSEPMTTYQLTLYKHFYAQKTNTDPNNIETHFALLKRTAKKDKVEFFRVSSGPRKTDNALGLLHKAIDNIKAKNYVKNKLSCTGGYGCKFYKTEHCPV